LTLNPNDKVKDLVSKGFPWGTLFAKRSNFEWGYLIEERRLVDKYLEPSNDVLIIGSGNGREARPICLCSKKIVCMDLGLSYLKSGRNLFTVEGKQNVQFVQADMTQLPFSEGSFDFIFFSLYSYAAERRFGVLSDIHRVLRPNGFVLLGAWTPLYRMKHALTDGEIWMANEKQLRQEVSSCGFDLLESAVDPARPEYRISIMRKRKIRRDGPRDG